MTLFISNIMSSAPKAWNAQEESEANAHETGSHKSLDINAQWEELWKTQEKQHTKKVSWDTMLNSF